jgi:hypothetical protein
LVPVVAAAPLSGVVLLPCPLAVTSSGAFGSVPLYSCTKTSKNDAFPMLGVTVTVSLAPPLLLFT